MAEKSRFLKKLIVVLIGIGLLFGVSHASSIRSKPIKLIVIMFTCMIAIGAAQMLTEKTHPRGQPEVNPDGSERCEKLTVAAKEQLTIVFGTLLAMVVPGLLFYIDQQTSVFSKHIVIVAMVITFLAIVEHTYAWQTFELKHLGKGLSLVIVTLTLFFAFIPVFQMELYPPASHLVSELLLMIYLPLCWSNKSKRT